MEYQAAKPEQAEAIFLLVQNTITTVYPRYYPKEVVDFFCKLHNRENIEKDIAAGKVGVLMHQRIMVGTGSHEGSHITRVYVEPIYQGKGYGSYIMQCIEKQIAAQYDKAYLDASLPACMLYEHRGYRTLKHETWKVENDVVLVYEVMEKELV